MTPSTMADGELASSTARNMTNLANQPANGGMPASENKKMVKVTASPGEVLPRPAYVAISALPVRRATAMTTANAPRFIAA